MRGTNPLYFPVPTAGLISNVPAHQIPPNALAPQSFNVFIDYDGLLKARRGYNPLPADGSGFNPSDYPLGFISFHNASDNLFYLVMQGGKTWQYFNGTDWINITNSSYPTTGDSDFLAQFAVMFMNGQSVVFGTNSVNQMRMWTPGQTMYQPVLNAPTLCIDITVIGNRLAAAWVQTGGIDFPFRVQWSAINDGTTWPIGAEADLQGATRDEDFIVGIKPLNRLNAAIYREDSIWIMSAQPGVDQTAFAFEVAPNAIGISGPVNSSSIVPFGGIHYYLARDLRIWTFDGISAQPISAAIDATLQQTINPQWLSKFSGAYLPSRQQIWWFFTPNVVPQQPYVKI